MNDFPEIGEVVEVDGKHYRFDGWEERYPYDFHGPEVEFIPKWRRTYPHLLPIIMALEGALQAGWNPDNDS